MRPGTSRGYTSYRDRNSGSRRLQRAVVFLLLFFIAYMTVHTLFLQTVRQDSNSMEPTLHTGDRIVASPILYGPRIRAFRWVLPGFTEPRRGDVVVVRPGYMEQAPALRRLFNPLVRFATLEHSRLDDGEGWRSATQIRRVIGLPGDTVRMERFVFYVRPAGETRFSAETVLAAREYETDSQNVPDGWQATDPFGGAMDEVTLGPDEYFVAGDNRTLALDSRHWGPVSRRWIQARAILRYWPFAGASSL